MNNEYRVIILILKSQNKLLKNIYYFIKLLIILNVAE